MTRRSPDLLDPLSAADREADRWLAARGVRWRWPRMQGAQPRGAGVSEAEDGNVQAAKLTDGSPRDPTTEAVEAAQTLVALRAGGLVDAAGRTAAAVPPATCGAASDDAPALPVAMAADLAGRSLRTLQTYMQARHGAERGGQLVLPCVPAAKDVYHARPRDGGAQ